MTVAQGLHRRLLRRALQETLWLAALVVVLSLLAGLHTFRVVVVEGASMEPTIHNGEHLLIDVQAYRTQGPARGDIVVFDYPHDPRREFIKRVVGLPGETVAIQQGQVEVNGTPLPEPYAPKRDPEDWGPVTVPPNDILVLGDNRPHSSDSRIWGPLQARHLRGRAQYVLWPWHDLAVIR